MRVFADAQALQDPITVERGIGRYVTELAHSLEAVAPGSVDSWVLRPGLPVPAHSHQLLRGAKYRFQDDPDLVPPDIWHVTSPFEALPENPEMLWPDWARGVRTKLVVTLYDLIPLLYPDRYLSDARLRRAYHSRVDLVKAADRVQAISEASAADAVRLLDIPAAKIDVVGTGVSSHFKPPDSRELALAAAMAGVPGLRPGYVMYTGGIDFRKNIDGLMLAYADLPQPVRADHQLVIVCRVHDDERAHLQSSAAALGIDQDFLLTGFVPDDVLLALYQSAGLFVFPSLYEGFGLPVAEALACGVPTIAGDNSSLKELLTDPVARFDSSRPESIAKALLSALTERAALARIVEDREPIDFRWSTVAERALDSYARTHRPNRGSTRPYVALVSPMPPAASGVADYSGMLLPELAKHVNVDVFCQPDAERPKLPGVTWNEYRDFDAVRQLRGKYSQHIIAMGNSEFHIEPLRILRKHGGTVMAHDVRYTGLMREAAKLAPELVDDRSRQLLDAFLAGRRPDRHSRHTSLPPAVYYRTNMLLCEAVVSPASRVFVHSNVAEMLARLNVPSSDRTKIAVAPFGHIIRADDGSPRDAVTSFGIVDEMKESETVLAAFIELAGRYPDLTFALVGRAFDSALWERLCAMRNGSPHADRIVLTGRVGSGEWVNWVKRSRLTVQLRRYSNGESSGCVADSLGAHIPVVASRIGSFAELEHVTRLVEPGVTVAELRSVLDDLLTDDASREELVRRGWEYAIEHTFADAARTVLDLQPE